MRVSTPRKHAARAANAAAAAGDAAPGSFAAGDKVSHGKWGIGAIVSVKGTGNDMELQIAFPAPVGVKRLLAGFAPITKVKSQIKAIYWYGFRMGGVCPDGTLSQNGWQQLVAEIERSITIITTRWISRNKR